MLKLQRPIASADHDFKAVARYKRKNEKEDTQRGRKKAEPFLVREQARHSLCEAPAHRACVGARDLSRSEGWNRKETNENVRAKKTCL